MMDETIQKSNFQIKNFKLLVAGYINVNVIDGSAFFLSGLVGMCSAIPTISTTLVTANPVRKTEVLDEILHYPNVQILDPYIDTRIQSLDFAPHGDSMSRSTYAKIIGNEFLNGDYTALLVRDTETGYELVKNFPDIANRVSVYITGITSLDAKPDQTLRSQIHEIAKSGAKIVSQTPTMAKSIASLSVGVELHEIFVLPPHIPDAHGSFDEVYHFDERPFRLAYTGKFFKAWNADKIFAAYKSVKATENPGLTFEVAGDQFRNDPFDTYFVNNVRYLLNSADGLLWHGRVTREVSRSIIQRSHIGISWRAPELDNSSELSTKILEYGAMGRPSILNRNELHEDLLGADYPLFANTTTEFKALLANLGNMANEVEVAARRCYELSKSHWYSQVLPLFMEHLGNTPDSKPNDFFTPISSISIDQIPTHLLTQKAQASINGLWFSIRIDADSESTVAELATIAKFQTDSWKHLSAQRKLMNDRLDESTYTSKPGAFQSYARRPVANSVMPDQDSVLKRLELAEQTNYELTEELRQLREKIDVLKGIRKRLETSRFGKYPLKVARGVKKRLM